MPDVPVGAVFFPFSKGYLAKSQPFSRSRRSFHWGASRQPLSGAFKSVLGKVLIVPTQTDRKHPIALWAFEFGGSCFWSTCTYRPKPRATASAEDTGLKDSCSGQPRQASNWEDGWRRMQVSPLIPILHFTSLHSSYSHINLKSWFPLTFLWFIKFLSCTLSVKSARW